VQTPTRFRLQPRDRGDTLSVSLVIRCPDFWPRVLQQRQTAACRSPHIDLRAQNACCRATRQIAARSERQADAAVTDRPPVRRQPSSPAAADRTAHVKPLPATAFGSSGKAGTLQHPGPIDRWSQKCPQSYLFPKLRLSDTAQAGHSAAYDLQSDRIACRVRGGHRARRARRPEWCRL